MLRIAWTRSRGIAVVDGRQQRNVVCRVVFGAKTHGRKRIGRPAARQVRGENFGPAGRRIDEELGVFAGDEIGIGAEEAGAQGQFVVREFLLVPQFVKPHRRQRLDVAHRHEAADIIGRQSLAGDPVAVGVQRSALDTGELPHVRFEHQFNAAVVDGPLAHAADRIAQNLADIGRLNGEAEISQVFLGSRQSGEGRNAVQDRRRRLVCGGGISQEDPTESGGDGQSCKGNSRPRVGPACGSSRMSGLVHGGQQPFIWIRTSHPGGSPDGVCDADGDDCVSSRHQKHDDAHGRGAFASAGRHR